MPKINIRKKCVELAKEIAKYRFHHVCQKCKVSKRGGHVIDAHHILSEGAHIKLSTEIENIVALCRNCHTTATDSWHNAPRGQKWFEEKFPGKREYLKNLEQGKIQRENYFKLYRELKILLDEERNKNEY